MDQQHRDRKRGHGAPAGGRCAPSSLSVGVLPDGRPAPARSHRGTLPWYAATLPLPLRLAEAAVAAHPHQQPADRSPAPRSSACLSARCLAEAAVIALPDKKWGERPLLIVVPRNGQASLVSLLSFFPAVLLLYVCLATGNLSALTTQLRKARAWGHTVGGLAGRPSSRASSVCPGPTAAAVVLRLPEPRPLNLRCCCFLQAAAAVHSIGSSLHALPVPAVPLLCRSPAGTASCASWRAAWRAGGCPMTLRL